MLVQVHAAEASYQKRRPGKMRRPQSATQLPRGSTEGDLCCEDEEGPARLVEQS